MHLLPNRLFFPCALSVRINKLNHFCNVEQSPARLSEVKSLVYLGFVFLGGASLRRIGDVDSRTISSGSNITVSGYASVGF